MGSFMNFPRVWYLIMRPEEIQALHILRERACKMLFNFSFFSSFIIVGFSTGATYTLLDFQVACNVSIGKCCPEQVFRSFILWWYISIAIALSKKSQFCEVVLVQLVLGSPGFQVVHTLCLTVDIVFEAFTVSMSRNAFGQSRDDDSK